MKIRLLPIPLLFALQPALAQQDSLRTFGGPPDLERASARVLYFDPDSQSFAGQFQVEYGQPDWRADYDDQARFDSITNGKQIRLGKNFWTNMDTSVPLQAGGVRIQPGYYYLGLSRSEDGAKWHLLLFDPKKARSRHLDASQTPLATPMLKVPLSKSETGIRKENLLISFSYDQTAPTHVTLKIEWGPHLLQVPIEVQLR